MQSPILGEALVEVTQREIESDIARTAGARTRAASRPGRADHVAKPGDALEEITLRLAHPDDLGAVRRLVDLDAAGAGARHMLLDLTRPGAPSRVLIASAGGRPIAAIHLDSGDAVADPFQPTAAALGLLRTRLDQLRGDGPTEDPGRLASLLGRIHVRPG